MSKATTYAAQLEVWKGDVYDTIEQTVAVKYPEVTADKVWEVNPSLLNGSIDPRNIGPVLKKAEKNGLIVKQTCPTCGRVETQRSTRDGNNATLGTVWKSLIYKAPVKVKP